MSEDMDRTFTAQKRMMEALAAHEPTLIGISRCHRSAVCIPFIETDKGYEILFEERSSKIDRQPGDVCFPGGMLEENETPREAVLREASEELLLEEGQLEIFADTDVLVEDGGLVIYTFAGLLKDYRNTFSEEEVARTFTIPLAFLLETEPKLFYTTEITYPDEDFPFEKIRGGRDYPWRKKREEMFFYEYKGEIVWGITARILEAFMEVCRHG